MPTEIFEIAASGDDGLVQASQAVWPPNANFVVDTTDTGTQPMAFKAFFSPDYYIIEGFLGFNTASLSDNAVISVASLRFHIISKQDANGRSFLAEWFDWGAAIDAADYTVTESGTAHSGTTIASITTGVDNDFALQNLGNISKTGMTKFRLHCSGAAPAANGDQNSVVPAWFDHATLPGPRLVVTYTIENNIAPLRTGRGSAW